MNENLPATAKRRACCWTRARRSASLSVGSNYVRSTMSCIIPNLFLLFSTICLYFSESCLLAVSEKPKRFAFIFVCVCVIHKPPESNLYSFTSRRRPFRVVYGGRRVQHLRLSNKSFILQHTKKDRKRHREKKIRFNTVAIGIDVVGQAFFKRQR